MTDLIPDGVSRLLLVEGPDDKQFFKRLLKHMQGKRDIPFDLSCFKIRKYRSKNKLGAYLFELLQHPNFSSLQRIWIVRDVDYNQTETERQEGAPVRTLQSVNTAIRNSFSQTSRVIDPPELQGFMTPSASTPSLSLLVLPNSEHATEGALETLLLEALADDPVMYCVDNFFECVKEKHPDSEVAANREDKNRLGVFLSGKLILRDMARSEDSTRELPRYMYNMKWWNDSVFTDPVFHDAKAFLKQLLAE